MRNASQSWRKDAAIALAILIVLILLVRLMTHSEKFGGYGSLLRTNIFGPRGVEFAEGLGLGTNQAGGAGAHEQGAITGEGIEALSVSNHPGNLLAAPQTNAEGIALTSSSSYSNLPVKV